MTKSVLFIDDNLQYQQTIAELLEFEGYQVTCKENATDGLKAFRESYYDLIITDLKMKTIDGLHLLGLVRKYNEHAKVIILTGSEAEDDELRGLDLQATDYIKKSTSINILLKRIAIALAQTEVIQLDNNILQSMNENIHVDLRQRKVYKEDEMVPMTQKEFALLSLFLSNKNVLLSREEILQKVWRVSDSVIDVRIVDTFVKKIRSKLQTSSIMSIRGIGYEWIE